MSAPSAGGVRAAGVARAPGRAAPAWRILAAQTALELRLTLRRGESVLLTLVIPVVLLAGFAGLHLVATPGESGVDFLTPGILALAVMSTAFTGQAIATGYERAYGVLKRLGSTPLSRPALLAAKTAAVSLVEVLQVGVLAGVGFALGWHPHGDPGAVLVLLVLGTAAFSALGLAMAGTLRAETTLAAANAVWLVLLGLGGVLFPLARLPGGLRAVAQWLPTAALADGLRHVLVAGGGLMLAQSLTLAIWAVVFAVIAALSFRWE